MERNAKKTFNKTYRLDLVQNVIKSKYSYLLEGFISNNSCSKGSRSFGLTWL